MENADYELTAEFTDYLDSTFAALVDDATAYDAIFITPIDTSADPVEIVQAEEVVEVMTEEGVQEVVVEYPLPGEGQWVFVEGGRVFVPVDFYGWIASGHDVAWIPDGVLA